MTPRATALNLARYCLEAHALDPSSANRRAFTFARSYDDASLDEVWSYAEVWERVQRIARGLLAHGLFPGDRVLLRLPHSPEYAFAFFGATLAGLVPIPASPQLTAEEAAFLLADADARAAIATPDLRIDEFAGIEVLASDLDVLDGSASPAETAAEDPAFLIYTSGTTARPKGVLHAQRTVLGRALMRDAWEGFGPSDVTLHAGTLNWSYTLGVGLMDPWAAGAHAVLFGGEYEPAGWPRLIERLGATVFVAVPTVYRQVLKYGLAEDVARVRLRSLRHGLCAGEAMPPALLQEWRERAGTELYEALGMTEVSTYISSGPSTPIRLGSPGRPQPGRRIAILPVEGGTDPLASSELGLLGVHRSDPGLMLGYWQRSDEEAMVYRGDWFVGGDLAAFDADGYLWFHGRADDVIKSFGYRLSPIEIEATLASCPGVSEVAVVGVSIDEAKTLVTACVVRASDSSGAALDEGALAAHARVHLAGYKQPHAYRFVDALPRTPNGKVQRRLLIEQVRDSLS
ncbi:MAG: long-chain fatty acid--CoA ligase [Dehalococcoidia bacterium]|nr:long-chain fatty acid--CoA ligase [Dehalococcoidia bacterium]